MPVPPIYQPEVPAEAIYWAAHHRRRELWVGYSAVEAILGSRLAPSVLGDRYLAKTGFSGQQVKDMPVDARARREPVRAGRRRGGHARHLRRIRPKPAARSCGRPPTAALSPARLAGAAAAAAVAAQGSRR